MEPEKSETFHRDVESVSSPAVPQSQPRSPRKSQQPKPKAQLQLFNPAHRIELTRVFQGLKRFQLDEDEPAATATEVEDEENELKPELSAYAEGELGIGHDSQEVESEGQQVSICTACNSPFGTIREQREHYRLDWHRYNVKRKVHEQAPVTEAEFDTIVDGLSSIEGSDSSDSEENSSSSTNSAALSKLMNRINLEASAQSGFDDTRTSSKMGRRLKGSPKAFFENGDGDIVMIYKTILSSKEIAGSEEAPEANVDFATRFLNGSDSGQSLPRWAVVMLSGGHFAASIVEGGVELRRKTFHSYTVRAKQGGSQGARDAKGGGGSHAKSAGASLRRYNEASFAQHIQELLESWMSDLEKCEWIFYRALSFNEKILFGGNTPMLIRSDRRLKTIPFPTKRPTNSEVKRVIAFLSAVQVYEKEDFLTQFVLTSNKARQQPASVAAAGAGSSPKRNAAKSANIDRARSRSPKHRDEPERPSTTTSEDSDPDGTFVIEENEYEIDLEDRLAEYGDSLTPEERERQRRGGEGRNRHPRPRRAPEKKAPTFQGPTGLYGDLLKAMSAEEKDQGQMLILLDRIQAEQILPPCPSATTESNKGPICQPINEAQGTFLHLAAQLNLVDVIWNLLELGSDPAQKDKSGKYPYNYAESKESRIVFRRFRAQYPDRYDYQRSQIPEPLTEEMERQKAEKKAVQNRLKREKEKQKKAEQYERKKENEEKDRFLNLSDREKRALAAERRLLGQAKRHGEQVPILVRCFECGVDITGKVPFEYDKNVFCTTKCLAAHRKKFPTPLTA